MMITATEENKIKKVKVASKGLTRHDSALVAPNRLTRHDPAGSKKVKVPATPPVAAETGGTVTKVIAVKIPAVSKAVADVAAKKFSTRYIEGVGRRKTSTARVRITEAAKSSILVNDKELPAYFATAELQKIVVEAFEKSKVAGKFVTTVLVRGGGIHSQAEALRHGLSRALVAYDLELRTRLKKVGFLKRDPRAKERRKFGLKKARKAPQWSKR